MGFVQLSAAQVEAEGLPVSSLAAAASSELAVSFFERRTPRPDIDRRVRFSSAPVLQEVENKPAAAGGQRAAFCDYVFLPGLASK